MTDGIVNSGRRGGGLEKAQDNTRKKFLYTGAFGGRETGMWGADNLR